MLTSYGTIDTQNPSADYSLGQQNHCFQTRAASRVFATNRQVVNNYFDMLYGTLSQNNILDKPSHIFNCDESGMPLQTSPKTIVTVKGQKHPYAIVSGTKKQITVLQD